MTYKKGKNFLDKCQYIGIFDFADLAAFKQRHGLHNNHLLTRKVQEIYLAELLKVVSKQCL